MAGLPINLAIVALIVGSCYAKKDLIVNTDRGPIKGIVRQTAFHNQSYLSFTEIPYAKPPVGRLRFKAPEDIEPWTEIRDATNDGNVCPQLVTGGPADGQVVGNENCLHLNVYTPMINLATPSESLATMVFIHGGGFLGGSKDRTFYGPDFFLEKNLIVVTLNYRLGALGFASLSTPDMPGNQGMKDQTMALRWISRNIEKFGGDPYNITLSGESSGSGAVQLHMLSDMSRGLFQKSIGQSGTILYTQTPEAAQADCVKLVAKLGYPTTNKKEMYDRLMAANASAIVLAVGTEETTTTPSFQPMVENRGVSPDNITFLSDCPIKKFATGNYTHMPHILGRNDQEMLTYSQPLEDLLQLTKYQLNQTSNYPWYLIPPVIREALLRDRIMPGNDRLAVALINFTSKFVFNAPTEVVQRYLARSNPYPVYSYVFTYLAAHPMHTVLFGVPRKGAGHADELPLLFHIPDVNPSTDPNDPDNKMGSEIMSCYWCNFAKTGNPTPPGAIDSCSAVKWEDSRPQGRMMNITNIPHMINRQTDAETETFVLQGKINYFLTTGCSR